MNILERQATIAREMAEINIDTLRRMADLAFDGSHRFVEMNARFVEGVAKRPGMSELFSLQREYGRSLVTGVRDDLQGAGAVLRSAASRSAGVLRGEWQETRSAVEEFAESGVDFVKEKAQAAKVHVEETIEEELERVDGIGSVYATQLREAGIITLAQLAALSPEVLNDASHPLHELKARIESEDWIGQARVLVNPVR